MVQELKDPEDIIKISNKISVDTFLLQLTSGTKKIVISKSILENSKNINLIIEALEKLYQLQVLPEIEIIERGKPPLTLKQDWIDPHIRGLIGEKPSLESLIRTKLLDLGATSIKKAVHISEFNKNELKQLSKLLDKEHIVIEDDLKIYLTDLGTTLAKGAKKIYN